MKKITCFITSFTVLFVIFASLVGCNSNNKSTSELSEEEIRFSTTEYTYDSFISDILQFGSEYNGLYYLTGDQIGFLSGNKSVEQLIDKTLIEKMRNIIEEEIVYDIAMLFPDSWYSHCKLVIKDSIYGYIPLFAKYLFENENYTIEEKVTNTIKKNLRDPESFYMMEIPNTKILKYNWNCYIKGCRGDQLYYVNENGCYTEDIYFFVEYYAKNGFGGYNKSGVWLSYSFYPFSLGHVAWTGNVGNDEYSSGYNLYGDNQNLFLCGSVTAWK